MENILYSEIQLCDVPGIDGSSTETLNDRSYQVYHYTNPNACQEIIKTKTLRFTDYRFLNDQKEYIHTKNIYRSLLDDIYLPEGDVKNMMNHFVNDSFLDHFSLFECIDPNGDHQPQVKLARFYVCSASLNSDSLPMWNYYLKNGKYEGYNLAFSPGMFGRECYQHDKQPEPIKLFFGEVNYDVKRQTAIIRSQIEQLIKVSQNEKEHPFEFLYSYFDSFMKASAFFLKRPEFSHEQEYRFVLRLPDDFEMQKYKSFAGGGFFVKNGMYVPYYDIRFDGRALQHVMLAPMLGEDIAEMGLRLLLDKNNLGHVKTSKSSIGIRY